MMEKEEYAIVLDFLPYGYPVSGKMSPLAQAIGLNHYSLLELVPRRGITLATQEKVYIGADKRDKIYYISGRLAGDKLTETAKIQLQGFIEKVVAEQEKKYIDFFNSAQAINTRLHQIELLPGFGRKHTQEILEAREQRPFESFEDIKTRVKNLPDPKKAIEKRLVEELTDKPRFKLFVK